MIRLKAKWTGYGVLDAGAVIEEVKAVDTAVVTAAGGSKFTTALVVVYSCELRSWRPVEAALWLSPRTTVSDVELVSHNRSQVP